MSIHQIGGQVFHYVHGGNVATNGWGGLEYESSSSIPRGVISENMAVLRPGSPHIGALPTRYLYRTAAGPFASGDWNSFGSTSFQELGTVPDPWFFIGRARLINVLGSGGGEGACLLQYDDRTTNGPQVGGIQFTSIGPSTGCVFTHGRILLPAGSVLQDCWVEWRPIGARGWTRIRPGSKENRCDAEFSNTLATDSDNRFAVLSAKFINMEVGAMRDVRVLINFLPGPAVNC